MRFAHGTFAALPSPKAIEVFCAAFFQKSGFFSFDFT